MIPTGAASAAVLQQQASLARGASAGPTPESGERSENQVAFTPAIPRRVPARTAGVAALGMALVADGAREEALLVWLGESEGAKIHQLRHPEVPGMSDCGIIKRMRLMLPAIRSDR